MLARPEVLFVVMGLALATSALIDLRRPSAPRNWPFRVVMLGMGLTLVSTPFTAAWIPALPAVVTVLLVVAAIVTFPRERSGAMCRD